MGTFASATVRNVATGAMLLFLLACNGENMAQVEATFSRCMERVEKRLASARLPEAVLKGLLREGRLICDEIRSYCRRDRTSQKCEALIQEYSSTKVDPRG